ncbi:lamin tail domain-containing protein [Nodularia harveyana UHCC-0300]|uniref:Lamin tail domain-containing protein n=1 Tax=Nodularia harveyana UHCC-0300 TaxID=2974287 RepID=A0ABU5U9E0_9CYAN|nr:lamin tail domain-containing protein [Nodularia harveyana]MEA5580150.1 lamin tail domain-containing protein [Nodularia harveyana UHCC-0300]
MTTSFSCLLTAKKNISEIKGTLSNATIDNQGPKGNTSVHITGADDSFVSFGTEIGQFGSNDFTVAFWVQTSESHRYFDIAGNRTAGSHGNFFCIRMTGKHESRPAGIISVEVDQDQNGTNYIAVDSKTAGFNDGKWHHIVVVRQGTSLKLYIDGVVSGNTTGKGVTNIANGNAFKLGRSLAGFENKFAANARYSGFSVYDTALNESDISSLFSGDETTVPALIGIGMGNQLWTRKTLTSNWEHIPNSGAVLGITAMPDGTIVGIGMNNQLWTRKTLTSNWEHIPNSGAVLGITAMPDGTIVGIGMDNQLWTRKTLTSNWEHIPNSGAVLGITAMPDGTIVGIGMNNQLWTRKTLTSNWEHIPNSGSVLGITVMPDGTIVGIGMDNQLWTRKTLTSNWEHIPNSGSVLGIVSYSGVAASASSVANLISGTKIKLKSWKGDYLHRPDSQQGVTTWNTGIGNEWVVELIGDNKIKLKSWKGDYLHRPDSQQGVTTWGTGIGNEWVVELIGDNKIKLKSWKGDYLHRPDSQQGVTTWGTGIGNEWGLEVISTDAEFIKPAPEPTPETPVTDSDEFTTTATQGVTISKLVHKGQVKRTQSDEYIEISNTDKTPSDISGWKITSAGSSKQVFTFPEGTILEGGKSFCVYTNEVHPETGGFSFGSKSAIWNDAGDEAKLFDAAGNNVSTLAYGRNTVAGIKKEFKVPELKFVATYNAVNKQMSLGGKVTFTEAVSLAIQSFLEDDNEIESPLGLIMNDPGSFDLTGDVTKAMATEKVRSYLNEGGVLTLYPTAELSTAENGETVEENWIFELSLPAMGDTIFWAIVPRSGEEKVYNYGFS